MLSVDKQRSELNWQVEEVQLPWGFRQVFEHERVQKQDLCCFSWGGPTLSGFEKEFRYYGAYWESVPDKLIGFPAYLFALVIRLQEKPGIIKCYG